LQCFSGVRRPDIGYFRQVGDRAGELLVRRAGGSAVSGCSSIGHLLLFCWAVLQNLGHGGFEGGGLEPRVGGVNVRPRQARFQFGAQLGGAVLGLFKAGGVI
jgi:hypothetical protein